MLTRLRERVVRVPEEISIVGCDDIFGADFCHPPLTTLTAPIEQAGRVAVSMLLSRLARRHRAGGAAVGGTADPPDRPRLHRPGADQEGRAGPATGAQSIPPPAAVVPAPRVTSRASNRPAGG